MFRTSILSLATIFLSLAPTVSAQDYEYDPTSTEYEPDYLSTYSIIVRDPDTGELGIGVASRVLAVGRNGSTFRGGVGVIVHQMSSNPFYGRIGMEMLQAGLPPQEIMAQLCEATRRASVGRSRSWISRDVSQRSRVEVPSASTSIHTRGRIPRRPGRGTDVEWTTARRPTA